MLLGTLVIHFDRADRSLYYNLRANPTARYEELSLLVSKRLVYVQYLSTSGHCTVPHHAILRSLLETQSPDVTNQPAQVGGERRHRSVSCCFWETTAGLSRTTAASMPVR